MLLVGLLGLLRLELRLRGLRRVLLRGLLMSGLAGLQLRLL